MAKNDEEATGTGTNRDMTTATGNTDAPVQQTIAQDEFAPASPQENVAPIAETPSEEPTVSSIPPPSNVKVSQPDDDLNAPMETSTPIEPPTAQTAQNYDDHDAHIAQDLSSGQIKAKTLTDLYDSKDTIGKIGTIFGLLVSGAGSGLTHQPNALLDMMNKQIDRDLEGQKLNVTNKQNLLALNYQHELQIAQQKRMAYENLLTQATAGAVPSENKLRLAQANALDASNAGLAALNRTKNTMLMGTYQTLQDQSVNNPSAQNVLSTVVAPAIQQQMQQNNAKTAAQLQLNTAKHNQHTSQGDTPTSVDVNKMQRLINLGKIDPAMPGAIPPGDVPQVTREAQDVSDNRVIAKAYDDTFKKLNSAFAAGKLNPKLRAAELATLGATIARDTTGRYNAGEALTQASGIFPEVTDYGSARPEKYQKFMDSLRGKEAGAITLARYGLKTPFPDYSFDAKKNISNKKTNKSGPIERQTADGQTALFDPVSKKFLGYKNNVGSVAGQ